MISLNGQTVIITGGSRGIGAATAILFAEAGADVAITYNSNDAAAKNIVERVEGIGRKAMAVKMDVAKLVDAERMTREVMERFGRIDVLVNNAGIWTDGHIGSMTEKIWDETMNVNLKGTFTCTNAVVPVMKKQVHGRIITVTSTAGQRGEAEHSHYAASKGGQISFTKSLSTELAPYNILVNAVAPGWVDTDLNETVFTSRERVKQIAASIPLRRVASARDVAGGILFLASELSNHITGEVLNVNGGSVLCG